jgi:hypothetical protein
MIQVFIDNVEVLCERDIIIKEEYLNVPSVILNNVYPKNSTIYDFYIPKDYSSVKIIDGETLLFAGVVKNTGNASLNFNKPKFISVEALDYKTFLSESKTLDYVISDKTVTEAITQVLEQIDEYGFIEGNIEITNDVTIQAYSTLNQTAYDVLQYLAELSQAVWTTRVIDEDTIAIDFYDPLNIPKASDIEYTEEYCNTNKIIDISYNIGTRDYRNKQYITSKQVYSSIDIEENIITDGYSKVFPTEQRIGKINSITIDGSSANFATQAEKDIGISSDFYYKMGENQISTDYDLASDSVIVINYKALVQGRQFSSNSNEIARIKKQTGRDGTITRNESRDDLISTEDLAIVAANHIKYKGMPEITVNVVSENDIFSIGQQVYFNAPIEELKTNYLIKSKTIKIRSFGDEQRIVYEYTLNNAYNVENAINFFDNQRRKTSSNISEGQVVTRNIDITGEAIIEFNNLVITELEGTGSNELDCALDSPLIY